MSSSFYSNTSKMSDRRSRLSENSDIKIHLRNNKTGNFYQNLNAAKSNRERLSLASKYVSGKYKQEIKPKLSLKARFQQPG